MTGQSCFNSHYKDLLEQLPTSIKSEVWRRLTSRKYNPLTEEQAGGIHPDIEELLTKEANRYFKKKDRQRLKVDANATPDGSSSLSRLDGFEKQLESREALLKQKEINIKNVIDSQVEEERKRLKSEYDILNLRLQDEYNKCFEDMRNKTQTFKQQLEDQHKSRIHLSEQKYKSRISTLDEASRVKDREIGKLSSSLSQKKNEVKDLRKTLSSVKKTIKALDDIIFAKDQAIIAYNEGIRSIDPGCIDNTIEPTGHYEVNSRDLWARWHANASDDPDIRKKYTFRSPIRTSTPFLRLINQDV